MIHLLTIIITIIISAGQWLIAINCIQNKSVYVNLKQQSQKEVTMPVFKTIDSKILE